MRKKGLILLAVIFIIILVLYYFLTDEWYKKKIEYALSVGVGAKVEIDGFYLSFLKLESGWDRIQIADPNDTWKNFIETDKVKFDVNGNALLYGRWVIEEMTVENMRTGTKRASDGKLPEWMQKIADKPGVLDKITDNLSAELEKGSGMDFSKLNQKIDVNTVISTLNLQTPDKLKNLQSNIISTCDTWQEKYKSIPQYKAKIEKLTQDAQSLNPDKLKSIDGFVSALNTVMTIRSEIDTLKTDIIQQKNGFVNDFNMLDTGIKSIDNWVKDDISSAMSKANLPELGTENIAKILFGREFADKIKKALHYYKLVQEYSDRLSEDEFTGQTIPFPDKIGLPKFWIKKISVSGAAGKTDTGEETVLSGLITDITSDQKIINKPTEIKLSGGTVNKQNYNIGAVLNFMTDTPEENFLFGVSGISLNNKSLKENKLLPDKIDKGIMNVKTEVTRKNNIVSGNIGVQADQLTFDFSGMPENQIGRIVQNLFKDRKKINVDFQFRYENENLKLKMSSNIDEVFSAGLKSIAGDEIKKGKEEIEKQVRKKLEPEIQKLTAMYNSKRGELESKMKDLEELISKNIPLIESRKKELEDKIGGEKNKGLNILKDNLLDKLKGIKKK